MYPCFQFKRLFSILHHFAILFINRKPGGWLHQLYNFLGNGNARQYASLFDFQHGGSGGSRIDAG